MSVKPTSQAARTGFDAVATVIKGVAAIYALFPGIAVLSGLVAIPPSLVDMVRIISFSVSGVVLISVFLLGERLLRLSKERAALFSVIAVLLGAICVGGYFQFANAHTVEIQVGRNATTGQDEFKTYIIPMNPSPQMRALVEPDNDYRIALQTSGDREKLKELMVAEGWSSMAIMILLLILSEVLLVAPVVAVAWIWAGVSAAPAKGGKKPPPKTGD